MRPLFEAFRRQPSQINARVPCLPAGLLLQSPRQKPFVGAGLSAVICELTLRPLIESNRVCETFAEILQVTTEAILPGGHDIGGDTQPVGTRCPDAL
eukprot:scaffold35333_cov35-Prasinocladus_malaysianus.AAC.1